MIGKRKFWIVVFLILSAQSLYAASVTLYVHNREFGDKVLLFKGVPYAPAESLLKAMKCTWCQKENTIHYLDQKVSDKELDREERFIGDLAPAQESKQDFTWNYSSLIDADVKVTLTEKHK